MLIKLEAFQASCVQGDFESKQSVIEFRKEWTRVFNTPHIFSLEKEMATHSTAVAWKIPWTEEPGRLQFMESNRVRHNWVTEHPPRSSSTTFCCFGKDKSDIFQS